VGDIPRLLLRLQQAQARPDGPSFQRLLHGLAALLQLRDKVCLCCAVLCCAVHAACATMCIIIIIISQGAAVLSPALRLLPRQMQEVLRAEQAERERAAQAAEGLTEWAAGPLWSTTSITHQVSQSHHGRLTQGFTHLKCLHHPLHVPTSITHQVPLRACTTSGTQSSP
jgi:hypothetical protein